MKFKKSFVLVLFLILGVLTLASCDAFKKPNDDGPDNPDNPPIPTGLTIDQVKEFASQKMPNVTLRATSNNTDVFVVKFDGHLDQNGNYSDFKFEYDDGEDLYYLYYENETCIQILQEEGKWVGTEVDYMMLDVNAELDTYLDQVSDITYQADDDSYVATFKVNGVEFTLTLKFAEGQLVSYTVVGNGQTTTVEVLNVGKTVVNLPDYSMEEEPIDEPIYGLVSQALLEEQLSNLPMNYTVMENLGFQGSYCLIYKFDYVNGFKEAVLGTSAGEPLGEQYYVSIDGVVYEIKLTEGVWMASAVDAQPTNLYKDFFQKVCRNFDNYQLDEETNLYVYESIGEASPTTITVGFDKDTHLMTYYKQVTKGLTEEFCFYDFGDTVVLLPNYQMPVEPNGIEEAFENSLANCTIDMRFIGAESMKESTFKFDNGTKAYYAAPGEGIELYYILEPLFVISYDEQKECWVGELVKEEENLASMVLVLMSVTSFAGKYVYNETNNLYEYITDEYQFYVQLDGDYVLYFSYVRGNDRFNFNLYDFGTTEIVLPEYEGDEPATGMSEKEWQAMIGQLLSADNFSLNMTTIGDGNVERMILQIDADESPIAAYMYSAQLEAYLVEVDGVYYNVMRNESGWVGLPTDNIGAENPVQSIINAVVPVDSLVQLLNYQLFTYDATKDKYTATISNQGSVTTIDLCVEQGLISYVTIETGSQTVSVSIYDYGTTNVKCPEFSIAGGNQESPLYLAAINEPTNYTLSSTIASPELNQIMSIKMIYTLEETGGYSEYKYYANVENASYYYVLVEGKYYLVAYNDEAQLWFGISAGDFDPQVNSYDPSKALRDFVVKYAGMFTYDEVNDVYKLTIDNNNYTVQISEGYIVMLQLTNEDSSYLFVFSDINTTVIEMPQYQLIQQEQTSKMTAGEFFDAIMTNDSSVQMDITYEFSGLNFYDIVEIEYEYDESGYVSAFIAHYLPDGEDEVYYQLANGVYYEFTNEDDVWVKTEIDYADSYLVGVDDAATKIKLWGLTKFDDLEFDENSNTYTLTMLESEMDPESTSDDVVTFQFRFVDNQLAMLSYSSSSTVITILFSCFNEVEVTLPRV